jgi:ketosteroid isomerase-like protein
VASHEAIEGVLESYRAAVSAKDVGAFVALYDDDVRVFDMWGRWSYDGAAEWRHAVADWFGSVGDDQVVVELHDLTTVVGDGAAAVHGVVTFKGLSAAGDELRAMDNRVTWVFRRAGDSSWKIVHEHTSMPIDLETSKPVPRQRSA